MYSTALRDRNYPPKIAIIITTKIIICFAAYPLPRVCERTLAILGVTFGLSDLRSIEPSDYRAATVKVASTDTC